MDYQNIILTAVAAIGCVTLAVILSANKNFLLQTITKLVQEAESAINGTGMGAEKKAWVIAQLRAAGVEVTKSLDKQIDVIVKYLNENGAWLADKVKDSATRE